ncbi:hypothetical protein ACEWET_11575, partial [Paraliobacillus sp. JSM ZJ581]
MFIVLFFIYPTIQVSNASELSNESCTQINIGETVFAEKIECNWGSNGPQNLKDNFEILFDQSQVLKGDYFLQTMADTGLKVEVDGIEQIDRWNYQSTGHSLDNIDRLLLLNRNNQVNIKMNYREVGGAAGIYSHVVPMGNWLTYRYDNSGLKG